MFNSQFKWKLLAENEVSNERILMDILFKHRNITNNQLRKQFLSEEFSFYDPFLFKDMKKIVDRIKEAIQNKEKIMIYGDYDVDGVTGVAILYKTLQKLTEHVSYYIPNRFTEGYGPNMGAFKRFVEDGVTLIITVDNGITGVDEAAYLKEQGVTFIVTDHHDIQENIPDAFGIVHPRIDDYPFNDLSGSGVSFKLAHALLGKVPYELIDLACLGTYADMVSLLDENRGIVKAGLKQLRQTQHLGLRLLMQMNKLKKIDESTLGFILGPRINAPGRMEDAMIACKLLITEDFNEAKQLVTEIEQYNEERKALIDSLEEEAIQMVEKDDLLKHRVLICHNKDWHEGVLGILCSRLLKRYNKPVIALCENEGMLKGSCRSLDEFHLSENLAKCEDILESYGGHKMAAGLTIKQAYLEELRARLHDLASDDLTITLDIDCVINEQLISQKLTNHLQYFRPFGMDNQNPIFLLKDYQVVEIKRIGQKNKHLKLKLQKNNLFLSAIAFNMGNLFYNINNYDKIDVVGTFEINEYNNTITNQINLIDIRCQHKQFFDYRNRPFDASVFLNKSCLYLYFNHIEDNMNAVKYTSETELQEDVVLMDLPIDINDLKRIVNHQAVKNIYILFKNEDLFTYDDFISRSKLGRIYQVYRNYKTFNRHDKQVLKDLEKIGCNKTLQNISLQVFFELNFVIIEDNTIEVIDEPEKRPLTESKTYLKLKNQLEMKDKLLLSSSKDLIEFLYQLLEVN